MTTLLRTTGSTPLPAAVSATANAISRIALIGAILVGAGASLMDEWTYLKRVPAAAHGLAWVKSEDDRIADYLHGWYPTLEALRKNTPEHSAVWGWMNCEIPPELRMDLFGVLRIAVAPRLLLPLESAASLEARQARLIDSGTSVYLFESHPRFAPPEPTWAVPDWVAPRSLGEWEVVQAQPDFTLHELRGPKVR